MKESENIDIAKNVMRKSPELIEMAAEFTVIARYKKYILEVVIILNNVLN